MAEEAEALNDMAAEAEEHFEEQMETEYQQVLNGLRQRMSDARRAEVGATIRCAQCGKLMVKTSYQRVFCSNAKTHGKHNCKDLYHNRIAGLKGHLRDLKMRGLED